MLNSVRMGWAGHAELIGLDEDTCRRILVRKPEGKRQLE
jgi:hypothetical protein